MEICNNCPKTTFGMSHKQPLESSFFLSRQNNVVHWFQKQKSLMPVSKKDVLQTTLILRGTSSQL
jgi:hypothetical protein